MAPIEQKYIHSVGGERPGAEAALVSRLFKDKPKLFRYFKDLFFELDASPQLHEPIYLESCTYHRERVRWILQHVMPAAGETILDVACGSGWMEYHASQNGALCVGFDDSTEQLDFAATLSADYPQKEKRIFLRSDAFFFPFKPSTFNKICSNDFFEHLTPEHKEQVMSEMVRVLKPEGSIFIHTPNAGRAVLGIYYRKFKALLSGRNPAEETTAFAENERGHIGLSAPSWYVEQFQKHGFEARVSYFRANIPKFKGPLLFLDWFFGTAPVIKSFFSFSFLVVGRRRRA